MNTNIRLLSLEYLRFFAAWNIFFGHYISFYIQFDLPYEDGIFPKFLFPYAGLSVPMFFMMSGAIFVHNYYDLISQKAINFQNYFQKRLARLYPLHFLTLLIMAVLQFYYLKLSGDYFVYPFNDLKHFILHLFFASHWGLEDGHSYNSVVWSVSHEIILYFLFFLVCFFLVNKINNKLGLFLGIFLVLFILNFLFGKVLLKSIGAFFIGSLIYSLVEYFQKFDQKKKIYVSIGTLIIFGICALCFMLYDYKCYIDSGVNTSDNNIYAKEADKDMVSILKPSILHALNFVVFFAPPLLKANFSSIPSPSI